MATVPSDQILAYLAQHPEAEDTIEGIEKWWLLEQRIRYATEDVEASVQELVRKKFLVTRECIEGRTYYRLNQAKEQEICSLLRQRQGWYTPN